MTWLAILIIGAAAIYKLIAAGAERMFDHVDQLGTPSNKPPPEDETAPAKDLP